MKIRIKSGATSSCLYRNSASIARRGDLKVYWVQPWFRLHPFWIGQNHLAPWMLPKVKCGKKRFCISGPSMILLW